MPQWYTVLDARVKSMLCQPSFLFEGGGDQENAECQHGSTDDPITEIFSRHNFPLHYQETPEVPTGPHSSAALSPWGRAADRPRDPRRPRVNMAHVYYYGPTENGKPHGFGLKYKVKKPLQQIFLGFFSAGVLVQGRRISSEANKVTNSEGVFQPKARKRLGTTFIEAQNSFE